MERRVGSGYRAGLMVELRTEHGASDAAGAARVWKRRAGALERLIALAAGLAALAVLLVAARLTPDSRGMGTHTQLGLPPCGWVTAFGKPCFTCGMTTAFARAARGDASGAVRAQPMGAMLAVCAAALFWAGVHSAATGSRLWRLFDALLRPRVIGATLAFGALAWAYKWATWGG